MKEGPSLELRNAIVWLERQPEVSSVVQGRYVRSRHKHKPGFTRIVKTDPKTVHLRAFDKLGSRELFVYAPPSSIRDKWVAMLAAGDVLDANKAPRVAHMRQVMSTPPPQSPQTTSPQTSARPLDKEAGQLYDVTPTLASKWLERNTRNRGLRDDVVQRYAADMKAGRWMVTGDAISFDKNGAVVNGQHRLWAVIFADVTVPMLVTFNLEPDVVRVLDDHLKRRLTDIVKISRPGAQITSKMTSISRVMQVASISLSSADKRAAVARISRQQQMQFLEKHEAAISFAARDCFKSESRRGLTQASIVGVVARAYYTQDHDRLKQFAAVLLNGIPAEPREDVAALLLRNWLLGTTSSGTMRVVSEVIYRKTERAVLAFCKQENLKSLYEASDELFLLPEDKAPRKAKQ